MNTPEIAPVTKELVVAKLRSFLADALKVETDEVSIHLPLLEMGASSLILVDSFRSIQNTYGVRPSTRKVFEQYPTLDLMAGYVIELIETRRRREATRATRAAASVENSSESLDLMEQKKSEAAQQNAGSAPRARATARGDDRRVPLTAAQQQLWFLSHLSLGASLAYHERFLVTLSGRLDFNALEAAFQDVVNRHEALRARLPFEESVQEIPPEAAFALPLIDLSAHEGQAVNREVAAWLAEEGKRPFALDKSLLRATVLRLRADLHLLAVTAHAIIVDQRALHQALLEVGALYSARAGQTRAQLREPLSFRAYVAELEEHAHSSPAQESRAYWLEQYQDGIPRLDLPSDRQRPSVQSYRGSRLVVPLEPRLVRSLKSFGDQHGSSLFVTLLSAFNAWLYRLTGERDVVVGIVSQESASAPPGAGQLMANTTNPLPLRAHVAAEESFEEHFVALRQSLLSAFDHRDYPFASLIQSLKPERDQSRSPVFVVTFGAEPAWQVPELHGLKASFVTAPVQYTGHDLQITLVDAGEAAELRCDYSTDLFDSQTIRRFMTYFKTLLEGIVNDPTKPVHALPLLSEDERRQLLVEWNNTKADYPKDRCIHHLFEATAARAGGRAAVASQGDDGAQELTYRELDQRSSQLARYLTKRGVKPGTLVGISIEPSVNMVVGVLGILKAGGAYVPLDPAYPRDRLAFMISDSQLSVLLTQSRLVDSLPEHRADLVRIDGDWPSIAAESDAPVDGGAGPESLAYVIYTSGSTGKPKGVEVPHRTVVNLLTSMKERPGLSEADRLLAVTSLSFDIAAFDLFLPLSVGARVEVVSRAVAADGHELRRRLVQGRASFMQATPATWQILLDAGWEGHRNFKALLGGEAVSRELADKLIARTASVWNGYGPTEATIYTSLHPIQDEAGPVPIGRPIANVKVYILDSHLAPTPIGVPGELYIGGEGLAYGYLRRPELTAERFLRDPFDPSPGARLYRTGDLCRYRSDGAIQFLGRLDDQIKLRGFRIELGEIEAVLTAHPAVREAVVVARKDPPGGDRIVAYVVPAGEPAPAIGDLRGALKEKLPEYMIPSAFVMLDALPRTPNNKVNRKALPAPAIADREAIGHDYVAPRDAVEEYLATTWAKILGAPRVGIHDDFFELGGHSLLITALNLEVRRKYQVGLSLRDFFDTPTIAKFAAWIRKKQAERITHVSALAEEGDDPLGGPAAIERFKFLTKESALDPAIHSGALTYQPVAAPKAVLLTGSTGFIGAYLLRELLDQTTLTVYCLVRAKTPEEAKRRINESLKEWNEWKDGCDHRIIPVLGDLTKTRMGLSEDEFRSLGQRLDLIVHSAAMVKFLYPFQTLKPVNVGGTQEVIRLAFEGRIKPFHYISTAAVFPMGRSRVFMEDTSIDQNLFLNLAYDETKWVSEKMLAKAAERGLPVAIYRMGEVCGHSQTGQSVTDHALFAFMKGCIQLKTFPRVDARLDMAPVDYVAQSVVRIAMRPDSVGKAYHISNPEPLPMDQVNTWFWSQGYNFDVVPYDVWREVVLNDEHLTENALYPFIGLLEDYTVVNAEFPTYDCTNALCALEGTSIKCHPVDEKLLGTVFGYLADVGFFPRP